MDGCGIYALWRSSWCTQDQQWRFIASALRFTSFGNGKLILCHLFSKNISRFMEKFLMIWVIYCRHIFSIGGFTTNQLPNCMRNEIPHDTTLYSSWFGGKKLFSWRKFIGQNLRLWSYKRYLFQWILQGRIFRNYYM